MKTIGNFGQQEDKKIGPTAIATELEAIDPNLPCQPTKFEFTENKLFPYSPSHSERFTTQTQRT
jgi:hypothetical protein